MMFGKLASALVGVVAGVYLDQNYPIPNMVALQKVLFKRVDGQTWSERFKTEAESLKKETDAIEAEERRKGTDSSRSGNK